MARTRLRDRKLPSYTKGEEIFNMVSHIVGGVLGITATVLCVVFAAAHHNVYGVVSGAIFGSIMIVLYTMSSIYHGLRPGTGKKVLQNVSFVAKPGEIVAIVGPSGEGKTTMIRLILGLVRPQEGEAVIIASDGHEVNMNAETRYLFSYVPQEMECRFGNWKEFYQNF